MEPKSLFEWRDAFYDYVEFLCSFWTLGAIGFRYGILRSHGDARASTDSPLAPLFANSASNAGGIGLLGVGLGVVAFIHDLQKHAESKHQSLGEAFSASGAASCAEAVLLAVLLVAFALAWFRSARGWPIAGVAALALALHEALSGRLRAMVNPLHVLGGSLWLGTLFVLVVCGLKEMLTPKAPAAEREQAVAEMVRRFSRVALVGAGLLGVTGVITSFTHLNPLSALWSTPYGYALISKLCVVAVVVGLGAWNWRRVGPSLGTLGGALKIRRTASTELVFAAVVLLITSILVSLPSPKAPKQKG